MASNEEELIAARIKFEQDFDASVGRAEDWYAMADIDENDDAAREDAYEERHHCEVCAVKGILEIVWDVTDDYICTLERMLGFFDLEADDDQ